MGKKDLKIIGLIVLVITIILVIIVTIYMVQCNRLKKKCLETRNEYGDICVDMAYYTKKIEKELDKNNPSKDTIEELITSMNSEIDEKMTQIDKINKEISEMHDKSIHIDEFDTNIGRSAMNAYKQWENDSQTVYSMNEQRKLINTRFSGSKLIGSTNSVSKACDDLILIYARSDLRHYEVYSRDEQTTQRFKEANVQLRYSEELEKKQRDYLREHYFGY